MKIKSYISLFLLLLSLITLGCVGVSIAAYTGDGKIEKVGKWPISKGYVIKFDTIKFNENFHREFKIENFPNIGKSFDFGIKVVTENKQLDALENGQLHMKVYSEDGTIYFDINEKISKWTFSKFQIDESTVESFIFYFDSLNGSYIDAKQLKNISKIKFSVKLDGMEKNPPITGEIIMRVGGYK